VTGVDKDQKCVFVSDADRQNVPITYDYLILATGASHSYFGHNEFAEYAPGLKTVGDAEAARNKILQAFELAEAEEDPARHQELLTFVLVGAGPTGVEMAGALAILVGTGLKSDFRRIDPTTARIVLVDMAPRFWGRFGESFQSREATARDVGRRSPARTQRRSDRRGRCRSRGRKDPKQNGDLDCRSRTFAGGQVAERRNRSGGRVRIQKDLTVPGHSEIFVVGDTASLDQNGKPLPGVAQVAMQQGRYAGKLIHSRIVGSLLPRI